MKIYLIILLLLLALISLISCNPNRQFGLIRINEIDCQLTEQEIIEINMIGENQKEFYQQIFNYPKNFFFKIVIFSDSIQYRKYQHKISETASSKNGFYSSRYKKTVIYKNKRFMKTIFHEMNHYILRSKLKKVPKWINEGLSEYYEMANLSNDTIKFDPQIKKVIGLKKLIQRPEKLDLTDFITWENKKWSEVNKAKKRYASTISWGIIYYLKSRSDGDEVLQQLLRDIKNGDDSIKTIEKNYEGGIAKLENDIVDYYTLEFADQ